MQPHVDQKLVMAHVYGHCLAPETEVETEDGIRSCITDVKVGDCVLDSPTGGYRSSVFELAGALATTRADLPRAGRRVRRVRSHHRRTPGRDAARRCAERLPAAEACGAARSSDCRTSCPRSFGRTLAVVQPGSLRTRKSYSAPRMLTNMGLRLLSPSSGEDRGVARDNPFLDTE